MCGAALTAGVTVLGREVDGTRAGLVTEYWTPVKVEGALVVLWVQSDRRERRRFDRQEDRTGGQQLTQYNDHLRRLGAESDRRESEDDFK